MRHATLVVATMPPLCNSHSHLCHDAAGLVCWLQEQHSSADEHEGAYTDGWSVMNTRVPTLMVGQYCSAAVC
jgi:hypothetical protein